MTDCPRCYNTSCPESAEITLVQATVDIAAQRYVDDDFSGTQITLPYIPGSAFPAQVYVNGVLQRPTDHYSISDAGVLTFTSTLTNAAVIVIYVPGA